MSTITDEALSFEKFNKFRYPRVVLSTKNDWIKEIVVRFW